MSSLEVQFYSAKVRERKYQLELHNFSDLVFPKEFISTMLKQAGFCDVKVVSLGKHDFQTMADETNRVGCANLGFNFITACKKSGL